MAHVVPRPSGLVTYGVFRKAKNVPGRGLAGCESSAIRPTNFGQSDLLSNPPGSEPHFIAIVKEEHAGGGLIVSKRQHASTARSIQLVKAVPGKARRSAVRVVAPIDACFNCDHEKRAVPSWLDFNVGFSHEVKRIGVPPIRTKDLQRPSNCFMAPARSRHSAWAAQPRSLCDRAPPQQDARVRCDLPPRRRCSYRQ